MNLLTVQEFLAESKFEKGGSLFKVPSEVLSAYASIALIAGCVVLLTYLEHRFAKHGKHIQADRINLFTKISVPTLFIGYCIYFALRSTDTLIWGWGN